jgi:hypothetical protein
MALYAMGSVGDCHLFDGILGGGRYDIENDIIDEPTPDPRISYIYDMKNNIIRIAVTHRVGGTTLNCFHVGGYPLHACFYCTSFLNSRLFISLLQRPYLIHDMYCNQFLLMRTLGIFDT